jgi:ABC-type oligopeptide transport system ATPase subunit
LLPCYKPTGGRLFFDQQELEEFIRKRRKATQDEISERAIQMINQRGLK